MDIKLQYLAKMNKDGVADNVHLVIDMDRHIYDYGISPWVGGSDYIDCKRRSDIDDLVQRLRANGYLRKG